MSRVAVNIVTYNSARTIEACLTAAHAQVGVSFEICIVDNASSDDTIQRVRQSGVEPVISTENLGYAAAHNLAVARTDSEYVLTLNPDVQLAPNYLQAMVNTLDARPAVGSAAGLLLRVESLGGEATKIDSTGLYMRRTRRQGLLNEHADRGVAPLEITPIFGPDGAAAFYRRDMLDDIRVDGEVFDPDFFMHKEDVDVCWRAQLQGWQSVFVPAAEAQHIRHFRPGQREGVSERMRFLGTRNRYLLMMKNELIGLFVRDLWAIAGYDAAILVYLLLRERAGLKALASAWELRKRMRHKRRVIQGRRTVDARYMRQWFTGVL